MKKEQLKSILKQVIKLTLTTVALIYVFNKIDFQQFVDSIKQVNIFFFILAVAAFNTSKSIAAFRVREFYEVIGINLDKIFNLKLYYVGMFYNLFLPGAIGGDGYKVYLLKQGNQEVKVKSLISSTLLDRLSGLALLLVLALLFVLFSSFEGNIPYFHTVLIVLLILVMPTFYLFIRFLFPGFLRKYFITSQYSFWVQLGQVLCAFLLLVALSVSDFYMDYLALFMASSVVAVLPFTIGGVGARELVFIFGFQYLNIEEGKAIAFTLLFFAVTAITALIGLVFTYQIDK